MKLGDLVKFSCFDPVGTVATIKEGVVTKIYDREHFFDVSVKNDIQTYWITDLPGVFLCDGRLIEEPKKPEPENW